MVICSAIYPLLNCIEVTRLFRALFISIIIALCVHYSFAQRIIPLHNVCIFDI